MSNKETHRTVCLSMDNYKRLCALGEVPDSVNMIVGRLIERHYEKLKLERENNK